MCPVGSSKLTDSFTQDSSMPKCHSCSVQLKGNCPVVLDCAPNCDTFCLSDSFLRFELKAKASVFNCGNQGGWTRGHAAGAREIRGGAPSLAARAGTFGIKCPEAGREK